MVRLAQCGGYLACRPLVLHWRDACGRRFESAWMNALARAMCLASMHDDPSDKFLSICYDWQLAPFNLKSTGAAGVPVPMKPNVRLPPLAPIVPFQCPAGLLAVTALPA